MRMIGEETDDETYLVTDKEPETHTEKAGPNHEATIQPRKFVTAKGKRQGECGGDQHHSGDGADAENQQVENRPFRVANRAQYQQSYRGGTCQTVNDADEQRAQSVKKPQPLKRSAQPTRPR